MNDRPKTICAWCGVTITPGDDSNLSHGICDECQHKNFPELVEGATSDSPAIREQCACCMYHRWGSCKGLATTAPEFCESWEPMPSRSESWAGVTVAACALGMLVIIAIRLFAGCAN